MAITAMYGAFAGGFPSVATAAAALDLSFGATASPERSVVKNHV